MAHHAVPPMINQDSIRRCVRRPVARLLRRLGLRLSSTEVFHREHERYAGVVEQLHAVMVEHVFPDLPRREGMIPLLSNLRGTQPAEAMFLLHYLHQALEGPGAVCEFGVAQGLTSALLANEILLDDRELWLFDSFEGLSKPSSHDVLIDDVFGLGSIDRYQGTMAFAVDEVRARLQAVGFPTERTRIVQGFIRPDLPARELPALTAFAYIDFDLYEPILTALRLLHSRTRAGSVLMIDDYGFLSTGVEDAVRVFIAERNRGDYEMTESRSVAGHFCVLRRVS